MRVKPIFLALVLTSVFLQGCVKVCDVSFKYPYSTVIGRSFILMQDCYVYKYLGSKNELRAGLDFSCSGQYLPKSVSPEFVQMRYKDVYIISILTKGTTFKVVACEEERRPEDTFRRFKAIFENELFKNQIIGVSDLTNLGENPPTFLDGLVKPLPN